MEALNRWKKNGHSTSQGRCKECWSVKTPTLRKIVLDKKQYILRHFSWIPILTTYKFPGHKLFDLISKPHSFSNSSTLWSLHHQSPWGQGGLWCVQGTCSRQMPTSQSPPAHCWESQSSTSSTQQMPNPWSPWWWGYLNAFKGWASIKCHPTNQDIQPIIENHSPQPQELFECPIINRPDRTEGETRFCKVSISLQMMTSQSPQIHHEVQY